MTIFSSDVAYEYLQVLLSAKPDIDVFRKKKGREFKRICAKKSTTSQVETAKLFLEHSDGPTEVLFDAMKIAANNKNVGLMDVILDKLKQRKEDEKKQKSEKDIVECSDFWCSLISRGIY